MPAVDTIEEASSVLQAAAGACDRGDHATARPLLESLVESLVVQGEQWTEVRFRLGDLLWHTGDTAGARELLDQAGVGQGPFAERARTHLAELDRRTTAEGEAADGVQAPELDGVINAAGEALMHHDYEAALALYQRAWGAAGTEPLRHGMLALGQAQCLLALARYSEAKEWYGWLEGFGDPMYATDAKDGLAEIARHEAALAASGDGTQVTELRSVWTEAMACYERGDEATALALWTSVYGNATLAAEQRGATIFNIAQCHIRLGDFDAARARFSEGLGMALGGMLDENFNDRLDMLDRQDAAIQTAGIVALP